jgi:hypothetical protein
MSQRFEHELDFSDLAFVPVYLLLASFSGGVWRVRVGRKLGLVLVGLGAFVLALALLSRFYAYDRLAVVPTDAEINSVSEGTGATIFDISSQEEITLDLESTRKVVGDVEASEQASEELGRDVAVWETLVFTDEPGAVIDDENPPRSATHDRVAFDRHTAEVIDCCGNFTAATADLASGEEERDEETPIVGHYFKLPFDAQKSTYQFWDGALKDATDMEYKGTESIEDVTVHRYEQVIEPTDVGDIEAPASFFGIDQEGDITLDRIYANTRTIWVEPETGVIFKGQEAQVVVAEYNGDEVATLTDATLVYNDATVNDRVDEYAPLASQLKLVRVWVPLLGGILGAVLILIGLVLLARGSSTGVRRAA